MRVFSAYTYIPVIQVKVSLDAPLLIALAWISSAGESSLDSIGGSSIRGADDLEIREVNFSESRAPLASDRSRFRDS